MLRNEINFFCIVLCGMLKIRVSGTLDEHDLWLKNVTEVFKEMSLGRKMEVFNKLLDNTYPDERYCLMERISRLLKRDIFISLPVELQEHICHFIDVHSLLVACSVSKEWNDIISSLSKVWLRKYDRISLGSSIKENDNYKKACLRALKFMEGMHNGSVFHHQNISGLKVSMEQITGLDYQEGLLIGCAENHIGVWKTKDFELVAIFQVPSGISCVQVYKNNLLAVGHNNGSITSWKLNYTADACTPSFHEEYINHTGVVMTLDVNCEIDLLVSGATDFTAKLWCVSSGILLKTLTGQSHWVVRVILLPTCGRESSETQFNELHSLLTMTRDHVQIYSWNVNSENGAKYGNLEEIEDSVIELPINPVHKFFTPGCHVVAGHVVYVKQTLVKDEEGDAEIIFQNIVTKGISRRIELKQKVRKLLGVGRKFALLLLPHSHYSKLNLLIVDLASGNVVGGCHLPHSSSSTPDLSQVTLGETDWLNDLSLHRPNDLVVALGLPQGDIRVVTWRNIREVTTG